MYRLVTFEATNISGFKSGLGKKTFRLDLRSLLGKDIIVILGDNATGKSTFLSLIHPMHTPSDKKQRFVVEGKEGMIVREYLGDDGTTIITKAIYTPKKDEGHTSKLYFTLVKGDKETELNPNGNVASYYALIDTYFGVNKEYIQFASYNDVVKGIVKMTDSERKLSVSSLVPNTNRFETAYNIINDKYRDLNNTLRNLSQKIVHLGEEDSLKRDLKRYDKEIKEYKEKRDDLVKKTSVLEGRIKELSGGRSAKEMSHDYKVANDQMTMALSRMIQQLKMIRTYCDSLYSGEINDTNLLHVANHQIRRLEKLESKIKMTEDQVNRDQEERNELRSRVSKIENQLNEYEASIFSLQCQSVEEMISIRTELLEQIASMEYTKDPNKYADMTYDEAVRFIDDLSMISRRIDIAYERFGELVTKWYQGKLSSRMDLLSEYDRLIHHLGEAERLKDVYYQNVVECESKRGLKDILDKRPATCTDDSCPFIANALKWSEISARLEDVQQKHQRQITEIEETKVKLEDCRLHIEAQQYMRELDQMMELKRELFQKYFNLTIEDLKAELATGQMPTVLDLDAMKRIAAVLSEKDLYNRIIKIDLPSIENQIKMSKDIEKNRAVINKAIESLRSERDIYLKKMDRLQSSITVGSVMIESYRGKLEMTKHLKEAVQEYLESEETCDRLRKESAGMSENIDKVLEMSQKMDANIDEIDRLNERMKDIVPVRDQVYYNLRQLCQLNLEKSMVDRDFLIISLMRRMVGPGKGIWKEAIDIYMQDINAIANELLLHMFNGNLSLNDFIIDDKRFVIPYTFNGNESPDISYASSSQQTTISNAISLAIISKLLDQYGILTFDEVDKDLSPINKEIFVKILATQMRYIGIQQCFVITHNPDYYESYYPGYICFPGGKASKDAEAIYV